MSMQGLVTRLGLDHSGFGAGLRGAGGELAAFAGRIQSHALGIASAFGAAFGTHHVLESAREQIRSEKKLESVLRSTAGAVGHSSEELREYAAELQKVTNFGDELTINGAAVLATFKQIKGQTFTDAIAVAQDMTEVLGQDLQSSIIQVGKALNDPIKGLTALRRVGVSFTQQQIEQIKTLQESGDLLGAQGVIMQELQSEFGGAARALASPITQLKNLLGDLAENLGFLLLPSVKEIANSLMELVGPAAESRRTFEGLGNSIASVVKWVLEHGRAIVAAVAFMVVYRGALMAISAAQKTLAIGEALLKSMQGPAGWAQLAAGAVAAGVAVGVLTQHFDGLAAEVPEVASESAKLVPNLAAIDESAGDAAGSIEDLSKRVGKLKEDLRGSSLDKQLAEIDALRSAGGLADFEASALSAEARHKASGSEDKIRELRNEIGKLKGTTDDAAIAFREMLEKGSTRAQAEAVRDLTGELEKLQAQKKAAEEQKREAEKLQHEQEQFRKSLISEVATPGEKFLGRVRELAKAFKEGTIAPELFARGIKKAREDLAGGGEQKTSAKLEGLQAGSKEALSALIAFNKQGQADKDANKKTEEHTRRMKELLAEVNRKLDRQLDAIEEENIFQIPG